MIFLLLLVPGTFLCLWIPELIFHPNDILLAGDGDGLKSYFCFFYHTHYDDSLIHFSGMNYPHGEHYLFTDGFPSIAWIIQLLPFLKPYGIAIIHLSLLLSLWLTPLFIYLVLKKFRTETWIALTGSLILFFLQPQFPRLFSHLSLAYSIFFPLSWYLFIRYKESIASKKWMFILIINQLFWYFMHPYLGFMITLFYGIQWALQQVSKTLPWKVRLMDLIPIVFPVLFVQLFLKWTDHITDRPLNPYGFFEYQAHWKSIFLPPKGQLHQWIEQFISFEEFRWEGQAYVGFLTIFMLSIGLIYGMVYLLKRRSTLIDDVTRNLLFVLIAALFILILSFGFPFNGNPGWLETLTFLKQFRALGRFSWPFFYVSGILGIVVLSFLYKQLSSFEKNSARPYLSIVFVSVLFGVQFLEAWNLLVIPKSFSANIFEPKNLNKHEKTLIKFCKKGTNHAILPLPWFHIGSEIYGKEASAETLRNSFLLSAHTGIPLYAVMMGRTSKQQTVDYFHSLGMEKTLAQTNLNKLWIYHSASSTLYDEDEQFIFNNAYSIYHNHFGDLKSYSKLPNNQESNRTFKQIVSDNFDDQKKWGGQIVHNKYHGLIENYNTLVTLDSNQVKPGCWYEITFDYFPDWKKPIDNVCYLEYIDSKTEEVHWFYERSVGSYTGIQRNSIKVKIRFKSQDFLCKYNCFLRGSGKNIFFDVDNLRVRELLK
ncbi:MAG: hypothetical protein RLZZ585_978 [Bacteroidota bacterium]